MKNKYKFYSFLFLTLLVTNVSAQVKVPYFDIEIPIKTSDDSNLLLGSWATFDITQPFTDNGATGFGEYTNTGITTIYHDELALLLNPANPGPGLDLVQINGIGADNANDIVYAVRSVTPAGSNNLEYSTNQLVRYDRTTSTYSVVGDLLNPADGNHFDFIMNAGDYDEVSGLYYFGAEREGDLWYADPISAVVTLTPVDMTTIVPGLTGPGGSYDIFFFDGEMYVRIDEQIFVKDDVTTGGAPTLFRNLSDVEMDYDTGGGLAIFDKHGTGDFRIYIDTVDPISGDQVILSFAFVENSEDDGVLEGVIANPGDAFSVGGSTDLGAFVQTQGQ